MGRGSAQAVRIPVLSGKVISSLLGPDSARRLAHTPAVLGVIDMRPLAASRLASSSERSENNGMDFRRLGSMAPQSLSVDAAKHIRTRSRLSYKDWTSAVISLTDCLASPNSMLVSGS